MATFPYLGSYGGSDTTDYHSILRDYDDGTYREYRKSTFKHRVIVLPFKSINKAKRDAIEAFYVVNRFLDITLYIWPETSVVGTGPSHVARIRGPLTFSNDASCRFTTQLTFKLLT